MLHLFRHRQMSSISIIDVPLEVLWHAFTFAPSPKWGQVNRQFRAHFAHRWVCTSLMTSRINQVNDWRGQIEKLDITAADDEGLCALQHLVDACPRLWNFSLSTRSSLPFHHATTLNRILQGLNTLTHFQLKLIFPGMVPLPPTDDGADNALLCLLHVGVQCIANNLCEFSLTLKGCELYDDACSRIVAVLPPHGMPHVHRLNLCLAHNHIDVNGARVLAGWVALLPALCDVEIDIAHNRGAPGRLAQIFATALEPLRLRSLSLRVGSTSNPCGYRLDPFCFQSTLKQVHMDVGFLHAEDVSVVFGAVPPTVQHLSVRTNPSRLTCYPQQPHAIMAMDAFAELPACVLDAALNRYTELRWLSLDLSGRCGADTLQSLAMNPTLVERMKKLQRMRLHVGGCHGRALTHVCGILSQWGTTVAEWDLGMAGDNMTDTAAKVFAANLSQCSMQHLHLDLSHNRIGPHGWTSLVTAIQKIRGLCTLHWKCNHNPIGYATPAAIFESVRVVRVEMRGCNLRSIDHWMAHAIRINLAAATSKEWTVVVSDNDVTTSQCVCMRTAGWIVVR